MIRKSSSETRKWRKFLALLIGMSVLALSPFDVSGQSASATYTAGDIPLAGPMYPACSGVNPLTVTIPPFAIVDSVDVTYRIVSLFTTNTALSRIASINTGLSEVGPVNGYYICNGCGGPGTITYTRTGLTFANGVVPDGLVRFRMQATTYEPVTCGTFEHKVPNTSWTITVHYSFPPCTGTPAPGNTTASTDSVCNNADLQLGLQNATFGSGVAYQWQVSTVGATGPWTNVGPNSPLFTTTQSQRSWYRSTVTCGGASTLSTPVRVELRSYLKCYCVSDLHYAANGNSCISNVTLGTTLNKSSDCNSIYSDYDGGSPNTTGTYMQGYSYPFSVSGTGYLGVWMDWDHNSEYSASEWIPYASSITIPYNALPGLTRMRVRKSYSQVIGPNDACSYFTFGETEDYTITILENICTPTPGNTIASTSSYCLGTTLTLSLQNSTIGPVINHQWQVSTVGANGPWTNWGTNTASISTVQTAASWYRAVVQCGSGGSTGTSIPVQVTMAPFYNCYCNTGLQSNPLPCISNISIGTGTGIGLNNPSTSCEMPSYTNYSGGGPGTTGTYMKGVPYVLSTTTNYQAQVSVWIDHDHNSSFDASEWIRPQTGGTSGTMVLTIPPTALSGATGMRVRSTYTFFAVGGGDACTMFNGESEDYMITIAEPSPCTGTPVASTMATIDSVCIYDPIVLTVLSGTDGTGLAYQWQTSSAGSGGPWTDVGTNLPYYQATQTQTTWYQAVVTCTEAGGGTAPSTPVQVTQRDILTCYCSSSALNSEEQDISGVVLGSMSNSSGCAGTAPGPGSSPGRYSNYTTLPPLPVDPGQVLDLRVYITDCGESYEQSRSAVFIDWNRNGILTDPGERVMGTNYYVGSHSAATYITVPVDASPGLTLMRVVNSVSNGDFSPCGDYTYGETEDYLIHVVLPDCVAPLATTTVVPDCDNDRYFINVSVTSFGNATSVDVTSDFPGNPGAAFGLTVTGNTLLGPFPNLSTVNITVKNNNDPDCDRVMPPVTFNCLNPGRNALNFDGQNDQVSLGNAPSLNITSNQITLEAWIYPTAWRAESWRGNIVNREGNNNAGYMLRCGDNGRFSFNLGDGSSWHDIISPQHTLTLNAWQHVAGTYDGSTMRMYVNGVEIANLPSNFNIGSTSNGTEIGDWSNGEERNFQGSIDEVRIWNKAVSGTKILAKMNTAYCSDEAGLVGYYQFDQGVAAGNNPTETILHDLTPNANHGTLTNFALTGSTSNWVQGQTNMGDCARCTGTPLPGATAGPASVCPGNQVVLGLSDLTPETGFSYQWYASTASSTGPWTAVGNNQSTCSTTQTAATWYYCKVTCDAGLSSANSDVWAVAMTSLPSCYCTSVGFTDEVYPITLVDFAGILQASCPQLNCDGGLVDYTGAPPGAVIAGQSYPIRVKGHTASGNTFPVSAFFDWDQDGVFETVVNIGALFGSSGMDAIEVTNTIAVPMGAVGGLARMRVITNYNIYPTDPCGTYHYGQAEDYLINVTAAPHCTGTPLPGATTGPVSVCPGNQIMLGLSDQATETGFSYQWYSSTASGTGPWTTVGSNQSTCSTTQTAATWYYCKVTCDAGPSSANSDVWAVAMTALPSCYCTSVGFTTKVYPITLVDFAGILQASCPQLNCDGGLVDYTGGSPGAVIPGQSYPIRVKGNTGGNYTFPVFAYFDWDQDGVFETAVNIGNLYGSTGIDAIELTNIVAVPVGAVAGLARMRVIMNLSLYPSNPCGPYYNGQAEDYLINVVPPHCTGTPLPGATAGPASVCPGDLIVLGLSDLEHENGFSYQWYKSTTSSTGPWTTVGNDQNTCSTTQTAATWYYCKVTCDAGPSSANSEVWAVAMNPVSTCTCTAVNFISAIEPITVVDFGGILLESCLPVNCDGALVDYTGGTPGAVIAGQSYAIRVKGNTDGNWLNNITAFFDWDQDGVFETVVNIGTIVNSSGTDAIEATNTIAVPMSALPGLAHMRVIKNYDVYPTDPCGTYEFGQAEDYLINVSAPAPDCNGVSGGTATIDNCGTCVGGNTGLVACVADCNGVFGGTATLDNCGTCVGGNTGLVACAADCNGVFGGTATLDNCGTCVGGNTGLVACAADCNGDFGGTALPGTACNDGNPNTINDVYGSDCTCSGTLTGSCTGNQVAVRITTDNNASQLTWEITNASNVVIATGAPIQNNSVVNETACLGQNGPESAFYGFRLLDSFGDGITNGGWELRTTDGKVLLRDDFANGFRSPSSTPALASYTQHSFSLPAGNTHIADKSCGIFNFTMNSNVYCTNAPGATSNQFEFSDPDAGFIRRITVNTNKVRFNQMVTSPLTPGVKYFVRARNNAAGPVTDAHFGGGCEVAMSSTIPCTELISAPQYGHSCNETRAFNTNNSFIYAQPVNGATEYQFRISIPGEGYDETFIRSTYILQLKWNATVAPPLVNGSTYNVQVNVKVGTLYSGFCGDVCTITIDNSALRPESSMMQGNGTATMWPNPVRESQVNLSIDGIQDADQRITVDIQDIYGKQVFAKEFGNSGERFSTILDLPSEIASGVYLVNIMVNGRRTVQRLSIMK